jgi:acyl carrier protein
MAVGKVGRIKRFEIRERVAELMEPWVSDLTADINEETNLIADLGLDSVGILQVILGAEKEFGISISEEELDSESFSRMGNLLTIIEKKVDETN